MSELDKRDVPAYITHLRVHQRLMGMGIRTAERDAFCQTAREIGLDDTVTRIAERAHKACNGEISLDALKRATHKLISLATLEEDVVRQAASDIASATNTTDRGSHHHRGRLASLFGFVFG